MNWVLFRILATMWQVAMDHLLIYISNKINYKKIELLMQQL
jgi:hypothetical protein